MVVRSPARQNSETRLFIGVFDAEKANMRIPHRKEHIVNTTERRTGTVSRGIRCPIIREGDDLASIVCDSVLGASESEGFSLRDRDVIAVTESVAASPFVFAVSRAAAERSSSSSAIRQTKSGMR